MMWSGGGKHELCFATADPCSRASRELPMFAARSRSLIVCACVLLSGCVRTPPDAPRSTTEPLTLTIGLPLISGDDTLNGIQQATRLLSFEGLVMIGRDGRPQPRLAQGWTESADGL